MTTKVQLVSNIIGNVSGGASFTGIVTAAGGFNLGISSAGTTVTSGPVKTLNFVGTGNTFAVSGTSVDISISSGAQSTMVIGVRVGTAVTFTIPTTNVLGVIARSGTVNVPV
jgi:hypothetical protein